MQREENKTAGTADGHDTDSTDSLEARIRDLESENRRLRESLGGQTDRLRLIVDSMPGPVAHIDAGHRFTVVNRPFSDLFAGGRHGIEGEDVAAILGRGRHRELAPYLDRAFAGEQVEVESTIELPEQGERVIRSSIGPDREPGGNVRGVLIQSIDITDQRNVAIALEETELRLRRIADAGIVGIGYWNQAGSIIDGNYTLLSMLGRTGEDLAGGDITLASITAVEYQDAHARAWEQMMALGFAYPYEKDIVRSDGSRLPVLFGMGLYEGRIDRGAFFVLDISDKRQVVTALRQSEERYRAWVANSTEAIWRCELDVPLPITLGIDEQIDYFYEHSYLAECNLVMAHMYGLEHPDQLAGTRLSELLVRTDPQNEAYLRRFILSGYRLDNAESIELDSNGSPKNFLNNLIGIIENGMLVRAWGTQRDITEQKSAERELEQAREAAESASRAKDRFLATLSHELRTPLTPVVAAIDLLRSEKDLPATVTMAIDIIARNIDLEARLIDDLLDLTRITNNKLELRTESLDLPPLLERVVEICQGDIEQKQLHLKIEIEVGHFPIEADPGRLQQVFWNLLKNAIKFTPEQGMIRIRCRAVEDRVWVEISDSGIGIEPDVLPRIFDPFEQGAAGITRRFGGLGLGLAISRTILAMHGGSLSAQSAGHNQGATFTVTLVRAPAAGGKRKGSPT